MQAISKRTLSITVGSLLALATGAAQAHTGHGASTFSEGLMHPFGLDHLLAMVAVGVWSVSALSKRKAWQGPATFVLVLALSALAGAAGVTAPYLEHAIALSVVCFGLMLVCARATLPPALGLGLIAVAASLHGLAHGAEAPATGLSAYMGGFLLTTAALHLGGVALGLSIQRFFQRQAAWLVSALGLGLGFAGLQLFAQL